MECRSKYSDAQREAANSYGLTCQGLSQSSGIATVPIQAPQAVPMIGYIKARSQSVLALLDYRCSQRFQCYVGLSQDSLELTEQLGHPISVIDSGVGYGG